MKKLLLCVLGFITSVSAVFALLLYFQVTNRDCEDISESEANDMIERILIDKRNRSKDDDILFGFSFDDIQYSGKFVVEESWTHDIGFIELEYHSRNSGTRIFTATIYENCEVQWIKST